MDMVGFGFLLVLVVVKVALVVFPLVAMFLVVRALLRWGVRLVHAEWSRCQDLGTAPAVKGPHRIRTPVHRGGVASAVTLLVCGLPCLLGLLALLYWGSVL